MDKKVVVKKKKKRVTRKKRVSRAKTIPKNKTKLVLVERPGLKERTLMRLALIFKALLRFIEYRIQSIESARIAKIMDNSGEDGL